MVRWLNLGVLLVAALGAARPGSAQTPSEILVTPEALSITVGQRHRLYLSAYDASGDLVANPRFTFVVSNATVIRAEADGTIVGLKPGTARIEVRAGPARATVSVTVAGGGAPSDPPAPPRVEAQADLPAEAMLTVTPATLYLLPGENARLEAQALLPSGVSAGTVRVAWTSLAPEIATVSTSGVVVGLKAGAGTILAAGSGGLTASVPVQVADGDLSLDQDRILLPPFMLDTLRVSIPSQGGRVIQGGLTFRSSDSTVVRVGPTGILQPVAPGEAEILVSGFFQERRARVVVHRPVARVKLSPPPGPVPIPVPIHGTLDFGVRLLAADSTPVPEAAMQWDVGEPSVIAFDPATRRVTAQALGVSTVTLRLMDFDPLHWTVQVVPGGLGLVPSRLALRPGERQTLVPRMLDDAGRELGPAVGVTFVSGKPEVAAIGDDGVLEARGIGAATVTAQAPWSRTATAEVFVVSDLLVSSNRYTGVGIYQVALAGAAFAPVLLDQATNVQAVWSPDRTRIAFSTNRDGQFELYLMDADGRGQLRLTQDPGADGEPAWLPDGSGLVFSSNRSGTNQIYRMAPDGSGVTALTSGPTAYAPAVSPDGRRLAFVSAREGTVDLYVMPLEGGPAEQVTRGSERESSPRFLPNGHLVWVSAKATGGSEILRWAGPGSAPAPVLTSETPISSLGVSRDGRAIAYVTGQSADPRGRSRFTLYLKDLDSAAPATVVPTGAEEQVATPSF